jgi:hypothetical protein
MKRAAVQAYGSPSKARLLFCVSSSLRMRDQSLPGQFAFSSEFYAMARLKRFELLPRRFVIKGPKVETDKRPVAASFDRV